jgi:hypothetical protein
VGADAEHATVNGMLPDFRFVLGAILAFTMLAVGGLGLVTSVQLVREAHMAPPDQSRSLAFAGRPERNQFYDPDAARRFEGLARKGEATVAPARLEPPAETLAPAEAAPNVIVPNVIAPSVSAAPAITPAAPEQRTTAIPAQESEALVVPETVPLSGDDKAPEKALEPDLPTPAATAPPPAETPTGERVARLPVPAPGPERLEEAQTPLPELAPAQPRASDTRLPDAAPPTPRARPKFQVHRRLARARIRRIPPVAQQPPENSGFPAPWPGYDNQFTGTTNKNGGKLTGTLTSRPQ